MGKRYGRNQKRKHRERIAELDGAYKRELELVDYHSREREKYTYLWEELVSEIRKWWDNSVLLDPRVEDVSDFPPYYQTPIRQPVRCFRAVQAGIDPVQDLTYQTLSALEVASMRDYGTRDGHIKLRLGDHQIGYYISYDALHTFKGMPQQVAKEVYHRIAFEINKLFEIT